MRTCNISSSPKEYMHVRAGREPNTAKSLFFLGWMGPWDTNRLRHILPPCAWFVRISLIGTHLPLKTWPWQHPVPLVDLKWTKPSFFNLQCFNSREFGAFSQGSRCYRQRLGATFPAFPTVTEVLMMSLSPTKETLSSRRAWTQVLAGEGSRNLLLDLNWLSLQNHVYVMVPQPHLLWSLGEIDHSSCKEN